MLDLFAVVLPRKVKQTSYVEGKDPVIVYWDETVILWGTPAALYNLAKIARAVSNSLQPFEDDLTLSGEYPGDIQLTRIRIEVSGDIVEIIRKGTMLLFRGRDVDVNNLSRSVKQLVESSEKQNRSLHQHEDPDPQSAQSIPLIMECDFGDGLLRYRPAPGQP